MDKDNIDNKIEFGWSRLENVKNIEYNKTIQRMKETTSNYK